MESCQRLNASFIKAIYTLCAPATMIVKNYIWKYFWHVCPIAVCFFLLTSYFIFSVLIHNDCVSLAPCARIVSCLSVVDIGQSRMPSFSCPIGNGLWFLNNNCRNFVAQMVALFPVIYRLCKAGLGGNGDNGVSQTVIALPFKNAATVVLERVSGVPTFFYGA